MCIYIVEKSLLNPWIWDWIMRTTENSNHIPDSSFFFLVLALHCIILMEKKKKWPKMIIKIHTKGTKLRARKKWKGKFSGNFVCSASLSCVLVLLLPGPIFCHHITHTFITRYIKVVDIINRKWKNTQYFHFWLPPIHSFW